MEIVAGIIISFLLIGASWVCIRNQRYKNFHRFRRPNDIVKFYVGEEKFYGRYLGIYRHQSGSVSYIVDGVDGMVLVKEIHPAGGVKYC